MYPSSDEIKLIELNATSKENSGPNLEYVFVALCRDEGVHNLGKVSVFIGEKNKGDPHVHKVGETTLADTIRREHPVQRWFAQCFWPEVEAAKRIRHLVPDFQDAAANVIVPKEVRVARRPSTDNVIAMPLALREANGD